MSAWKPVVLVLVVACAVRANVPDAVKAAAGPDKSHQLVMHELNSAALKEGRWVAAARQAIEASRRTPRDDLVLTADILSDIASRGDTKADLELRRALLARALELYDAGGGPSPAMAVAWARLARYESDRAKAQRNIERARDVMQRAASAPAHVQLYARGELGVALDKLGQPDAAGKEYDEALALLERAKPDLVARAHGMTFVRSLEEAKDVERSLKALRTVASRYPREVFDDLSYSYMKIIRGLIHKGRRDEAVAVAKEALAQAPSGSRVHLDVMHYGTDMYIAGDSANELALLQLCDAPARADKEPDAKQKLVLLISKRAQAHLKRRELERVRPLVEEALAIRAKEAAALPKGDWADWQLASALGELGELQRGLAVVREAIARVEAHEGKGSRSLEMLFWIGARLARDAGDAKTAAEYDARGAKFPKSGLDGLKLDDI
jgi:tetratricopeptide (TPR) repeat protein